MRGEEETLHAEEAAESVEVSGATRRHFISHDNRIRACLPLRLRPSRLVLKN